jgi:prepilin-type N-terminal cleavage/methylation domain-containing protein
MIIRNTQKKKGFTLIELMVAVTIFSIVMVISMGAILTVVDGNKKNQTMQVAINNLNFAVESMTRSIKTGYDYSVAGDCRSISLYVSEDQDGDGDDDRVSYSLQEHGGGNDNEGLFIDNEDTGYSGFITAPDLNIIDLCFEEAVDLQPALTIVIRGETTGSKEGLKTAFNLYTSVTQRQVQYD